MTYRNLIKKYLRDDIAQQMFELPDTVFKRSWDDESSYTVSKKNVHLALSSAIDALITWSTTPQGHDYWSNIYSSIMKGSTEYLRSSDCIDSAIQVNEASNLFILL